MKMKHKNCNNQVILIHGPMFSDKTKILIDFIEQVNPKQRLIFNSQTSSTSELVSRYYPENRVKSISIKKPTEILDYLKKETKVVFIDEFQFFNRDLASVIRKLKSKKISVYLAGLDFNFKGDLFDRFNEVYPLSTTTIQTSAKCHLCEKIARYSAKLVVAKNDNPKIHANIVEIENEYIEYVPVCDKCHSKFYQRIKWE